MENSSRSEYVDPIAQCPVILSCRACSVTIVGCCIWDGIGLVVKKCVDPPCNAVGADWSPGGSPEKVKIKAAARHAILWCAGDALSALGMGSGRRVTPEGKRRGPKNAGMGGVR